MQVEYSKLPKSRALLNIEIETPRVNKAFNRACINISKKANVPGFRKGKVPRKILERVLGKELISEEAKNLLLIETYSEAIKQVDLHPVGEPELDVKKFEEGHPMTFTAEVDIKPIPSLPEYKSLQLEIEKEKFEVKDKYIDESLNIFQNQLAETKEITERGIQKGDFIDIALQITYPDEADQKMEPERKRCLFEEENFEVSVMKEIEGLKLEETKEFEVSKPSLDEDGKEIGTRKAVYSVTVNSIIELKLPELTDEFIVKNTKFNTLEEVKEEFRREWERILLDKKRNFIKETIIDKLLEKAEKDNNFEVPETLLLSKANSLMNTHIHQLSKSRISLEDYLAKAGLKKEEYIEKLKEEALRIIKTDLILDVIGDAENIQVPDEKFKEAMDRLNLTGEKNLKAIDRKDVEEYMVVQLRKQRVLDFLIETIPVTEN